MAAPATTTTTATMALRGLRALQASACASCRADGSAAAQPLRRPAPPLSLRSAPPSRAFSQSRRVLAGPHVDKPSHSVDSLLGNVGQNFHRASPEINYMSNIIPGTTTGGYNLAVKEWEEDSKHKLHIYATKHNTHITLAKPDRDALISVSCGNIGFRKAARGSYDAGYQLAAFVMSRIKDKGLLPQIQKIELVYRGFGAGREAVTKAILGAEGKRIRPLIVKLSDSTRLKFGGVRSKKPRRLG